MHSCVLMLLAGCVWQAPGDTAEWPDYPLDDTLRLNHLQAKGTHNSYHVETLAVPEWQYTHAPLDQQLGLQGVRQFELDLYWQDDHFAVMHVPFLDEGTTCPTLVECLSGLKGWSDDHPWHHPLMVLIELKNDFHVTTAPDRLAALDAEVLSVWPEDRLVMPEMFDGAWPTLGEVRGRTMLVLHAGGGWRDSYGDGPLFRDAFGDLDLSFAAYHTLNDPFDPRIREVVDAGHLVRTRCDADGDQDTTRRDQALASGAHFVSTDFPVPVDGASYWVDIPGGTPSRCNPRTAPETCTAGDIESGLAGP